VPSEDGGGGGVQDDGQLSAVAREHYAGPGRVGAEAPGGVSVPGEIGPMGGSRSVDPPALFCDLDRGLKAVAGDLDETTDRHDANEGVDIDLCGYALDQ